MRRLLVIVAAGSGTRLGRELPKALVPVGGVPILERALGAFAPLALDDVVVAAPESHRAEFERITAGRARLVAGGATRSASARAGFSALDASDDDVVAVHDAARPLLRPSEAEAVYAAAAANGAAIAAIPVVDTIKLVHESRIVRTVDRSALWAAATPQAFRARVLRLALESGRDATDEAALCEDLGIPVEIVAVSRLVFKVTTPEDLELADAVLRARQS